MKQVVDYVVQTHNYSQRRACRLTRQHRSTQRKPSTRDSRNELRQRMHEIVATRIRYGYRRVHIMLKRDGWEVGRNVVYRLYKEEGLCLRSKRPRKRKMAVHRQARCQPKALNEAWSLDFVHDQLACGAKIRLLTVIDVYSRECLAIEVGSRLRGEDVARVLNRLVYLRGAPKALFADNGAEFIFEGKPSAEIRQLLKSNAFRWSPTQKAWQRQLTNNARYVARLVVKKLQEEL